MPSEVAVTPEMKASIGIRSEPVTWEVEKGEIVRFASAIGDPNPLYSDEAAARRGRYGGIIAPPTFLHAYGAPPLDFEYPPGWASTAAASGSTSSQSDRATASQSQPPSPTSSRSRAASARWSSS